MPKFNDFARLALKNDDHATTDLGCGNCHDAKRISCVSVGWRLERSADSADHTSLCKLRSLAARVNLVQPPSIGRVITLRSRLFYPPRRLILIGERMGRLINGPKKKADEFDAKQSSSSSAPRRSPPTCLN